MKPLHKNNDKHYPYFKRPAHSHSPAGCRTFCVFAVFFLFFSLLTSSLAQASYPIPPHVIAIGAQNNSHVKAGYLPVNLYHGWNGNPLDPTGVQDSTLALQKAMDDAIKYGMVAYLPTGTYLVSDTLHGKQDYRDSGCAVPVANYGPGRQRYIRQAPSLVGSALAARPLIRLASNLPRFSRPDTPRSVVHFYNSNPDNNQPGGDAQWSGDADCAMSLVFRGIDIDVGAGNPGAIGLQMASAEYSILEDVRIDATGGYAGIRGVPMASANVNIEIIGGRFGIIPRTCCGVSMVGLKLRGQTEAALLADNWGPLTVTGFEIEKETGSAILLEARAKQASSLALIDGVIRVNAGSVPAITNPDGQNLYLKNVYIESPGPLIKSASQSALSNPGGGWNNVKEYVYTNHKVHSGNGYTVTSYNLIDGVRGQDEIISVDRNPGSPPADLLSRHTWSRLPSFEDEGVVNVLDTGAKGDDSTDDTAAIQRAIDNAQTGAVFLPRGDYQVSGTLKLKANTRFFGVEGHRSRLMTANWDPQGEFVPVISSPDDAQATTYLANIFIRLQAGYENSSISGLRWRTGRYSMLRDFAVSHAWSPKDSMQSKPRKVVHVSENGGGRWYSLSLLQDASNVRNQDYRLVLLDKTSQPITFYGPVLHHTSDRNQMEMEIDRSANVRLLGMRWEAKRRLLIDRSNNVMVAGMTGNNAIYFDQAVVRDSNDILLALKESDAYSRKAVTSGSLIYEENSDGNNYSIGAMENASLYKRGNFDDSVFPYCGDDYCDAVNETTASCPQDCSNGSGEPEPDVSISACNASETVVVDGSIGDWTGVEALHLPASLSLPNEPEVAVDDADSSATVRTMWDADKLFVLVEVSDDAVHSDSDAVYKDDAVELYFDGGHERESRYDSNDFQLTVSADGRRGGVRSKQLISQQTVTATANGYMIEYAIPWSSLGVVNPGNETTMGFDIAILDDDDGGDAIESQLAWSGDGSSWQNPQQFGTLLLSSNTCNNGEENAGENTPPVANDDSATTDEDVAITIDVLSNDHDVDGDSLQITAVTQGDNGSVSVRGASVIYTPNAAFSGEDRFDYTISDKKGGEDRGTVTITVNPQSGIGEMDFLWLMALLSLAGWRHSPHKNRLRKKAVVASPPDP